MKFETYYKNARNNISQQTFKSEYSYELALYNHFVDLFIPNEDQDFTKSWRWNIQQNALQSKHDGKTHIKQLLNQVFDAFQLANESNIDTSLENEVLKQFNYLDVVTCDELMLEEEPFLEIAICEMTGFKYEVTLTLNNPNLFLLVAETGDFRVQGHSSWSSAVMINGHNQELVNYLNQITGE